MPFLAQCAGELDALVRKGRTISLGDRNPEQPYADLDALLFEMGQLAERIRSGLTAPPVHLANDRGAWHGPSVVVVTGREQILCAPGRSPRR
ncbi:hypothetical protein [Methylobacterium gossipiicola]|uniref:Uncharacterized protein n=1 Tax=Methylobacterium gossipiicola TaxID=582675 RepID=A0A1I2VU78_9HYPH|nr:hypothetical protein [Methylobacterium gossipiicola]SFG92700.1 hypothetical protein SAMN05192565_11782 [Methylobacterium gossipiicola]